MIVSDVRTPDNRDHLPPPRKASRCLRRRRHLKAASKRFSSRSLEDQSEARQEHLELIRRMKEGLRVAAGKNSGLAFRSFGTRTPHAVQHR